MNNNYHVIYSKDPYLLARMYTELMMGGKFLTSLDKDAFNKNHLHISGNLMAFYNHGVCFDTPTHNRHTLTKSNYLTVLKAVLNEK